MVPEEDRGHYLRLKNAGSVDIEPYGAMEVVDRNTDWTLNVRRPTGDSKLAVLVNGPTTIPVDRGDGGAGVELVTASWPLWVQYDGTAPAAGDKVGTQTDSFKVKKSNKGLLCLAVDTGRGRCLVRPFNEGNPPGRMFSGKFCGGTLCSSVIRFNETAGTLEPYQNKTGFNATQLWMQDGFVGHWIDSAVVGNDLYICTNYFGNTAYGWDGAYTTGPAVHSGCPGLVKYDRVNDKFIPVESSSTASWYYSTTPRRLLSWNSKLVVLGAQWNATSPNRYVNIYDPTLGTWTNIPSTNFYNGFAGRCTWSSGFVFAEATSSLKVWYCDGSSVVQLGGTFNTPFPVELFTDVSGSLYAVGYFTSIGGVSGFNRIVKYDTGTSAWVQVGGGVNASCHSGWSDGDKIVVCSNTATGCGSGPNAKSWTLWTNREMVMMRYDASVDEWTYGKQITAQEFGLSSPGGQQPALAHKIGGKIYVTGATHGGIGSSYDAQQGQGWFDGSRIGAVYEYSEVGGTPTLTEAALLSGHQFMRGSGTDGYTSEGSDLGASLEFLVKLPKINPEDDQQWFLGGNIGSYDSVWSDTMPHFDGTEWQLVKRSERTYVRPIAFTSPFNQYRGFTVGGRNFYVPYAFPLAPRFTDAPVTAEVDRFYPMVEFGTIDANSWAIPSAWSTAGYTTGDENVWRIWFPEYRFNYPLHVLTASNYSLGLVFNLHGSPIMYDSATDKSIMHYRGGGCILDPIDGSPDSNFAGVVEIDWTNRTLAPAAFDPGYGSTRFASYCYCNGSWYAQQWSDYSGGSILCIWNGSSWVKVTGPTYVYNGNTYESVPDPYFLYRLTDTILVLMVSQPTNPTGPPANIHQFVALYDTTSSTWTAQHWDMTNSYWSILSMSQYADRIFWTQENDTLYMWAKISDSTPGLAADNKYRLAKIDLLGKTIPFKSMEIWAQPRDNYVRTTMMFPTKEILYVVSDFCAQNRGRVIKSRTGYLRGFQLFKYNFTDDVFEKVDDSEGSGTVNQTNNGYRRSNDPIHVWGDETCDYGNRLIITP